MKTKTLEKIARTVICAMMVMTLVPAPAYAKTRSVSVSPSPAYSYGYTAAQSKRIYKGTTRVTLRKGSGTVYFRAPKKGTYTFRIYHLKGKKGVFSGNAFILYDKSGKAQVVDVLFSRYKYSKGAWGNDNIFLLAMAGRKIGSWPRDVDADKPQKSMTAKIDLKKGETLCINFGRPQNKVRGGKSYTEKTKVTVKIS